MQELGPTFKSIRESRKISLEKAIGADVYKLYHQESQSHGVNSSFLTRLFSLVLWNMSLAWISFILIG